MSQHQPQDEESGDDAFDDGRIDGDGTYPFAGLTRFDSLDDVPDIPRNVWRQESSLQFWASNELGRDAEPEDLPSRGLFTMLPQIPAAAEWPVAIVNPRTGEMMETLKHKAVVNRNDCENVEWGYGNHAEVAADAFDVAERDVAASIEDAYARKVDDPVRTGLSAHLDSEQVEEVLETTTGDDVLFNIPTSNYTIINPQAFLEPLCEVLRDRELAENCFGELRVQRSGGRATLELFFDGKHVEAPIFDDEREPVVVGLEVQWDFYGDWAVRSSGIGFDWACVNAIHRLTNREVVKHSGDVDSRQDWVDHWESMLDGVDEKVDQLARVIELASEAELDFSELPDDIEDYIPERIEDAEPWAALYYYSGLPSYLAEHAGQRLRQRSENPYRPTWWDIHSAATYAITHHGRGDPAVGGSIAEQAQVANDMLMNPASMEDRITRTYETRREAAEETTAAGEGGGVAQIRTAFETTREKKEQYEEWQEQMAQLAPAGPGGGDDEE